MPDRSDGRGGQGDREALGEWIRAWAAAPEGDGRRDLELWIFEAITPGVAEAAKGLLRRTSAASGVVSVEEVVQEVGAQLPRILQKYLESIERLGRGDFRAYAARSGRNIADELLSRRRREREICEHMAESSPSSLGRVPTTPSRAGMRSEIRVLLSRELECFEPLDQTILRRRAEGISFAEIGRQLGIPATTVSSRYERCASHLRRVVERAMGGDPFEE